MLNKFKESNFKTQLEPQKEYANNIKLYILVVSIIMPLFAATLFLASYPNWFVYTVLAFWVSIVVVIVISKFSDFIRIKIRDIATVLLFCSNVSFIICVYYNHFNKEITLIYLISYCMMVLSLRKPKQITFFTIGSFLTAFSFLLLYQPNNKIWFLVSAIMFFSSAMSLALAKRNERTIIGLNQEASFMSDILNNTGIGYILFNKELDRIVDFNNEAANKLGKEGLFNEKTKEDLINIYKTKLTSNKTVTSFEFDFENLILDFNVRKLITENNTELFLFKFLDATEEKLPERIEKKERERLLFQTKLELRNQIIKLSSIYEHSPDFFIWNVNENLEIIAFNKYFQEALKVSIKRKVEKNMSFDQLFDDRTNSENALSFKKALKSVLKTGKPQKHEGKFFDDNNETTWLVTYITPIFDKESHIKELICISHNISEIKIYQEQLKSSLKEQETLLQEVHHRVKNNLQIISSILNLQTSYVEDENILEVLNESQNRIKSMSYIHESLYMNKDFSSINFKDYLLNLVNNLVHSYQIFEEKVEVLTEIEEIHLGLDQSITTGLLLNEIISNALKHAFKGKKENKLFIKATESNGVISILIKDNGVGIDPKIVPEENESLGMQLIFTLIEQLEGNIQLTSEKGTEYLITFEKQNS